MGSVKNDERTDQMIFHDLLLTNHHALIQSTSAHAMETSEQSPSVIHNYHDGTDVTVIIRFFVSQR